MDALIQDEDGRVVGVRASHTPRFLKDGTQLKGLHYDESIQDEADELTFHATKAVIVCTGGGMSNVDRLYATMPTLVKQWVFGGECETPIRKAVHGDSSGVRGAAWLWPE